MNEEHWDDAMLGSRSRTSSMLTCGRYENFDNLRFEQRINY